MPWTVSHAAAALPLRRFASWPLDFAALVIGSMTPDLGYYFGAFPLASLTHTFAGSFLVGLPTGAVLLLAFLLFCRPVCYALPRPHRAVLLALCPSAAWLRLARWPVLALSLLVGIWTHNFWDAFTHESGWFVQRISWLRDSVVRIGPADFGMPFVLQVSSSAAGFVVVAVAYFRWLRRQPARLPNDDERDGWRYLLALAICAVALLVAVPAALRFASSRHGALFVKVFVVRAAFYAPAVAVPLGLLAACITYARRSGD